MQEQESRLFLRKRAPITVANGVQRCGRRKQSAPITVANGFLGVCRAAVTTRCFPREVRIIASDAIGIAANATYALDVGLNNDGDFLDSTESG